MIRVQDLTFAYPRTEDILRGVSFQLEGGHTLALLNEDAGMVATLDAAELALMPGDFEFGNGNFISAEFLAGALGGTATWSGDKNTLLLQFPTEE